MPQPDALPRLSALAAEVRAGQLPRRDFLTLATAFGASAAAAFGLLGLPAPARAQPAPAGPGTLRCQMLVPALRDPRGFDITEMGNIARGVIEPLVIFTRDFTLEPWLLSGWQLSGDARSLTLQLREGVTWANGEPLTADHIAWNLRRWCDRSAPGNSMAGRMASLIDPATGQIAEGVIEILSPTALRLHLPRPDVTLIPGMADYPALILHPSFDETGDFAANPLGTGPCTLDALVPGSHAVLTRRPGWWGGEIPLARIEYLDLGTDPRAWTAAFAEARIDMVHQTSIAAIPALDALGLARTQTLTAATIVARTNTAAEVAGRRPYADPAVRRALQLAVDPAVVLELGHGGAGIPAENHHVAPMHPDYAALPPQRPDRAAAKALHDGAGMADFVHELISIDDDWRSDSADAIAAQLMDAGIKVTRRRLHPDAYWAAWADHPFSVTDWNMRPLGVQILALGYRSGEAWNETRFSDPAFDALLAEALALPEAADRIPLMARLQEILRSSGVIIQPYWRAVVRHAAPDLRGVDPHPGFEHHHHLWSRI